MALTKPNGEQRLVNPINSFHSRAGNADPWNGNAPKKETDNPGLQKSIRHIAKVYEPGNDEITQQDQRSADVVSKT